VSGAAATLRSAWRRRRWPWRDSGLPSESTPHATLSPWLFQSPPRKRSGGRRIRLNHSPRIQPEPSRCNESPGRSQVPLRSPAALWKGTGCGTTKCDTRERRTMKCSGNWAGRMLMNVVYGGLPPPLSSTSFLIAFSVRALRTNWVNAGLFPLEFTFFPYQAANRTNQGV
jgi:hypothetical protein